MEPIIFFAAIVFVIWVLSSIASAMSKQKESQRRQQFREMMEQAQQPQAQRPPQPYRPAPPAPRARPQQAPPPPPPLRAPPQLNPAYQVRHPEMMMPPPPQMARPAPAAMRMPSAPPPRRPQQQQQRAPRHGANPRATTAHVPPPIPVLQADDSHRAPERGAVGKPPATPQNAKPQATQVATAPAIARWLNPGTLRQQFILTEIFQPPLAMREERFG